MTQQDRLEVVGQTIIGAMDDLRHIPCPGCGNANLVPIFAEQHLIIKCHAPVAVEGDTENDMDVCLCPFSQIVYLTSISKGPFTLRFSDVEPKRPIKAAEPPKKASPRPRRRKSS